MDTTFADRRRCFIIETESVALLFPANICRDCGFQSMLAQLLKLDPQVFLG
jgi:hypothetical protein